MTPARTFWTGLIRRAGPILLVALAVQTLLAYVAARAYLTERNTLFANGRWSSTKIELEKGLNGSYGFIHERQALAGGRLNLAAWFGYQEVLWRQQVESLSSLAFDFEIEPRGWVAAVLDRGDPGEDYAVVRLSNARRDDSGLLTVSADGRFLKRRPLSRRTLSPDTVHHAKIDFADGRLTITVDGEELGDFPYNMRPRGRFGFRGGHRAAYVDNVRARSADGSVRESFDSPPWAGRLTGWALAAVTLLNLSLFVLLAAVFRVSGRNLGFYLLMINLTLLVLGGIAYVFVRQSSTWYPGLDRSLQKKEEYFRRGESARVRRQVAARFAELAGQDRYRILFVGSSQTWGAGARRAEEAFVPRLERLLNDGRAPSPRIACINGGISAAQAANLVPVVEEWLETAKPDMVVINLSSNDTVGKPNRFEASIRAMVERTLEVGARPVLIQEPRVEKMGRLGLNHETLRRVAADHGIPVIELMPTLRRAAASGFLWWDPVHLTSYGQAIVAEQLSTHLQPLLTDARGVD